MYVIKANLINEKGQQKKVKIVEENHFKVIYVEKQYEVSAKVIEFFSC